MEWLRKVMAGRYGTDQLTVALFIFGLLVSILGGIFRFWPVQLLSYFPLVFGIYRSFSRNIYKRREENAKFLVLWGKVKKVFRPVFYQLRDIKTYRYFKCPSCKTLVRVPKGKGRIVITCPKCKNGFIKKT